MPTQKTNWGGGPVRSPRQCRDALDELMSLAPWTELLSSQNRLGDFPDLTEIPTLRELAALDVKLLPTIAQQLNSAAPSEESARLNELQRLITAASRHARTRIAAIKGLALQCDALARMDYGFLFDEKRHLLAIGYNVGEHRRDASYYDLLASEARFSSFVAIAQGQLPQESWFALGRLLTIAGGEPILLSWSGSMFEYLMPLLVMPTYEDTLLDQTYKAAVARQIEYGKKRGGAVGHFGMRLQCHRCASQLPIPRLWRSRPGAQTRAGRGPGDCALCLGAGADGGARGGLPESPATRCRRALKADTASTKRSTTRRRVCRADKRAPWCAPSWPITRA